VQEEELHAPYLLDSMGTRSHLLCLDPDQSQLVDTLGRHTPVSEEIEP
jgi:hypothetical protein